MKSIPELVVYVDENGNPTGETAPKLEAHNGRTKRHAAFSCFIFDENGRFLVTERALTKKVWPGVWTNSVCGHLLPGETHVEAIVRRAQYELGLKIKDIKVILPNYFYQTPPYNGIVENEFCPVFLAKVDGEVRLNPAEVADYEWMNWSEFVRQAESDNENKWSYWCKDQIKRFDEKILAEYTEI